MTGPNRLMCRCRLDVCASELTKFFMFFVFFSQKMAYEMRISDWSSDVCATDLISVGTWTKFVETGATGILQPMFDATVLAQELAGLEIGSASCRERVCPYV